DPLGRLDIDAHRDDRRKRDQKLRAKRQAPRLNAGHQKKDGEANEMPVIRQREKCERQIELGLAWLRVEVKAHTRREEKDSENDESDVRPARAAKGEDG